MVKYENNKITKKIKGVFSKLKGAKDYTKEDTGDEGYQLLMGIVDRKVFDVEDSKVTSEEFNRLTSWSYEEFKQTKKISISGRVIREDPIVIVEVVEEQPVFIEIQDYKVRYRVNLYHETQEVEIEVIDPIKDKELGYKVATKPTYVF